MLQFLIVSPLLFVPVVVVVPIIQTPLVGKLPEDSAEPISQFDITLLSLPVVVEFPPINIVPPSAEGPVVAEPKILQFLILLFLASLCNRIVEVPATDDVEVLEIVKPLAIEIPSMVTLSAPLRSINGRPGLTFAEMVLPLPTG